MSQRRILPGCFKIVLFLTIVNSEFVEASNENGLQPRYSQSPPLPPPLPPLIPHSFIPIHQEKPSFLDLKQLSFSSSFNPNSNHYSNTRSKENSYNAPDRQQPVPDPQQSGPGLQQPAPSLHQPGPGLQQPEPGLQQPGPGLQDPIWSEVLEEGQRNNSKRAASDLYNMIKCGTGCNPLVFKGYGCYCGFLGSGGVVDGIDRCCKMHDWCYTTTTCVNLEYNLPYFVPYKWTCNGGAPYCMAGNTKSTNTASCGHQLCECDREFVECLSDFKCPHKKAMCKSPWRYFQNLFMGLGTGMPMDDSYNDIHGPRHHLKPRNPVEYPKPKFHRNRVNIEVGRV